MSSTIIITSVLSLVGLTITFFYSWHTKKLAQEKMQKELFTELNERYSKLNDSLSIIEKQYKSLEELEKAEDAMELKQKVIDYFSLCAEEFYWYYHKKRIDKIIWNSWYTGMNYWYNNVTVVKELWKKEIEENGKLSYYITDKEEFFYER